MDPSQPVQPDQPTSPAVPEVPSGSFKPAPPSLGTSTGEIPIAQVRKEKSYIGRLFSNRIGRLSYFLGVLLCIVMYGLISLIPTPMIVKNIVISYTIIFLNLVIFIFFLTLVIRRLRDLFMPRWLVFLVFIPLADVVFGGILAFKPGVKQENDIVISKKGMSYVFKEIFALKSSQSETSNIADDLEADSGSGKKKFPLIFLIFIAAIIVAFIIIWFPSNLFKNEKKTQITPSPSPVACTTEAKQCPDGSYVSRKGPKCQFAPCPTSSLTPSPTISKGQLYENSQHKFRFTIPDGWKTIANYPNGILIESPDARFDGPGYSNVKLGALLSIVNITAEGSNPVPLETQILSISNIVNAQREYLTVDGTQAAKFERGPSENRNKELSVVFIKNNRTYLITESYAINSVNPFPDIVDRVASSFSTF